MVAVDFGVSQQQIPLLGPPDEHELPFAVLSFVAFVALLVFVSQI